MFKRFRSKRSQIASRRALADNGLQIEKLEDRMLLATYTVTNTVDDGLAGSLTWAINQSNASVGVPDTIDFNVGGGGAQTISSAGAKVITDAVTIDGSTQPGFVETPLINIDAGGAASFLTVVASNTTLKDFQISNNVGVALFVTAVSNIVMDGLDVSDTVAIGGDQGIQASNVNGLTIQNSTVTDRDIGINISSGSNIQISCSIIHDNSRGIQFGLGVNPTPLVFNNSFSGNGTFAIFNESPIVNAQSNYWGHPDGPRNISGNPAADGFFNSGFGAIDGSSWWNNPPLCVATPTDTDGAANTINEGALDGSTVGVTTFVADPDDMPPAPTYNLIDDAGGRFALDSNTGVVTVAIGGGALLNYEDATSHVITVQAQDASGTSRLGLFTINVLNVNPSVPVDADGAANEVVEGAADGTPVGITASSTDPNGTLGGGNVSYGLTDDAGGRFAIASGTGVVSVAVGGGALLNFAVDTSHNITVEASDGAGGTSTETFTINVLPASPVAISGTVFVDADGDGMFDGGTETPIDGVTVELLNADGTVVLDSDVTSLGGVYAFEVSDSTGTFRVRETQPTGVIDGDAILGSEGGTVISSNEMQFTLAGSDATDYDFTEVGEPIQAGDTATIGFWQNKHGRSLIEQGGPALVDWLNDNFGNIFGSTFSDGNGGDDAAEVASFYKHEFFKKKLRGTSKVDAQFMATALATFFTSSNLSGGNVATSFGFNVTETGIGTNVVNVGSSGAAFGVADNTDITIMAMLLATNGFTGADADGDNSEDYSHVYDANGDGILDENERAMRAMANNLYSFLNESGDI